MMAVWLGHDGRHGRRHHGGMVGGMTAADEAMVGRMIVSMVVVGDLVARPMMMRGMRCSMGSGIEGGMREDDDPVVVVSRVWSKRLVVVVHCTLRMLDGWCDTIDELKDRRVDRGMREDWGPVVATVWLRSLLVSCDTD